LTRITAIAGGANHSIALKSDGTVWDWGFNGDGQLGNDTTTGSTLPVQVVGLTGITAIAGGANHSIALKSDGTVWDWGFNGNGQLGNGTTTGSTLPVQVVDLDLTGH
jgi:alpha-tubulin suppressor-like RCC1 family protein